MDMILFEVIMKSIDMIPQQLNRYYNGTIYIIDNVIVLSDLVESSGYSSKTLQKGSYPYAPLDEVLRYIWKIFFQSYLNHIHNLWVHVIEGIWRLPIHNACEHQSHIIPYLC